MDKRWKFRREEEGLNGQDNEREFNHLRHQLIKGTVGDDDRSPVIIIKVQ